MDCLYDKLLQQEAETYSAIRSKSQRQLLEDEASENLVLYEAVEQIACGRGDMSLTNAVQRSTHLRNGFLADNDERRKTKLEKPYVEKVVGNTSPTKRWFSKGLAIGAATLLADYILNNKILNQPLPIEIRQLSMAGTFSVLFKVLIPSYNKFIKNLESRTTYVTNVIREIYGGNS